MSAHGILCQFHSQLRAEANEQSCHVVGCAHFAADFLNFRGEKSQRLSIFATIKQKIAALDLPGGLHFCVQCGEVNRTSTSTATVDRTLVRDEAKQHSGRSFRFTAVRAPLSSSLQWSSEAKQQISSGSVKEDGISLTTPLSASRYCNYASKG
jgi:hypothetical protein